MQLPPFRDYRGDILRGVLGQPAFTPSVTVNKARLWAMLPLWLKHAVYDDLAERLAGECEAMRFDVDSAFPEPLGMEQYREEKGRRGPEQRKKDLETPAQQIG